MAKDETAEIGTTGSSDGGAKTAQEDFPRKQRIV